MSRPLAIVTALSLLFGVLLLALQLYMLAQKKRKIGPVNDGYPYTYKQLMLNGYRNASHLPVLGRYLRYIFKRLISIETISIDATQVKSMKLFSQVLLVLCLFIGIMTFFVKSVHGWIVVTIVLFFIAETLVDYVVHKRENELLTQLIDFLSLFRTQYFETLMVDEALYQTVQYFDQPRSQALYHQGHKIYEVLMASDGEISLEQYYQVAPNHYLKLLAGMAYMTKEYGDSQLDGASVFAKGLGHITLELRDEVRCREQLNFSLKSLSIVVLMPLFALRPLRLWASASFMPLRVFYDGPLGFMAESLVLIAILVSYALLKRVQSFNNDHTAPLLFSFNAFNKSKWSASLAQYVIPNHQSWRYHRFQQHIHPIEPDMTIEQFYQKKCRLCAIGACIGIIMVFVSYGIGIHSILFEPILTQTYRGGELTDEMRIRQSQETEFDLKVLRSVGFSKDQPEVRSAIESTLVAQQSAINSELIKLIEERIMMKLGLLKSQTPGLLHGAFVQGCAVVGWFMPNIFMLFQRRMTALQMNSEIGKFQLVILVLMSVKNLGVDDLLIWLERFSLVFREPLRQAIMDYEAGASRAIANLQCCSKDSEYQRIIYQLGMCVENLSIAKAFEEMDSEKMYYQERRQVANARMVTKKVQLGEWIGFAPLYSTIGVYFMVPMVYASIAEMQVYFNQLM